MKHAFLLIIFLLTTLSASSATSFKVDDFYYEVTDDTNHTVKVRYYTYSNSKYNATWAITVADVPETVVYKDVTYTVTGVGAHAFQACAKLTTVTLPKTIESIAENAFYGCSVLTSVTLSSSPTTIEKYAFYGCKKLDNIDLGDAVTTLNEFTFAYCNSLSSIRIPDSVTSIERFAFTNCTALTDVKIGASVSSLSEEAFTSCTQLESITIPANVKTISEFCFRGCSNLQSIKLSEGLEGIGKNAFYETGLKTIKFPNSLQTLDTQVCNKCNELETVFLGNKVSNIKDAAFANCPNLKKFYITTPYPPVCSESIWGTRLNNPTGISTGSVNITEPFGKVELIVSDQICVYDRYSYAHVWSDFLQISTADLGVIDDLIPETELTHLDRVEIVDGGAFALPEKCIVEELWYSRNFNDTKWQALYIPFALPYDVWNEAGLEVARICGLNEYDDNQDGSIDRCTIEIQKMTQGATTANKPYLIRAKTSGNHTIELQDIAVYGTVSNTIDCSTLQTTFNIVGTYIESATTESFYMQDGHLVAGNHLAAPFTWYIQRMSRSNKGLPQIDKIKFAIFGDINADERVSISDVNALIDILLK